MGTFSRMDLAATPFVLTVLGYAIKHWLKKDGGSASLGEGLLDGTADVFAGLGSDLLHDALKSRAGNAKAAATFLRNQHLDLFVAEVIKALILRFANDCTDKKIETQLIDLAKDIPEIWTHYADAGHLIMAKYQGQNFAGLIADELTLRDTVGKPDSEELAALFKWIATESDYQHLIDNSTLDYLARALMQGLPSALAGSLVSAHPTAEPAFKKTLLCLQSQALRDLASLRLRMERELKVVRSRARQQKKTTSQQTRLLETMQAHQERLIVALAEWQTALESQNSDLRQIIGEENARGIADMRSQLDTLLVLGKENLLTARRTEKKVSASALTGARTLRNTEQILAVQKEQQRPPSDYDKLVDDYLDYVRRSFQRYDEGGIPILDKETAKALPVAAGSPQQRVITEIFIPPACATEREACHPDVFTDLFKRQQHPDRALLDELASETRRHVLLADPGFGKSTLIQWLIVALAASHRGPVAVLPADLRGAIPLPLIVRDLAAHLGDDLNSWRSWDCVVVAWRKIAPPFIDGARALLHAFDSGHHEEDFQRLLADSRAFFLIDGLDEIGDQAKRAALAAAIQDGFLACPRARWLITSRVVGYDETRVHLVRFWGRMQEAEEKKQLMPPSDAPTSFREESAAGIWLFMSGSNLTASIEELVAFQAQWRPISFSDQLSRLDFDQEEICVAHLLYLAPFDDKRRDDYLERWFYLHTGEDQDSRAARLKAELPGHPSLAVISRIPNILCMVARLAKNDVKLPDGRAGLYECIAKAYLSSIQYHKKLPQPKDERRYLDWLGVIGLHMQQARAPLLALADSIKTFLRLSMPAAARRIEREHDAQTDSVLISSEELECVLRRAIERDLHLDVAGVEQELRLFLRYILDRAGLLQPRGQGSYGFVHASFLEYFAACYVWQEYDRGTKRRDWEERRRRFQPNAQPIEVPEHLRTGVFDVTDACFEQMAADSNWLEVLIFIAEAHPDALDVIMQMAFPGLEGLIAAEPEKNIPLVPLDGVRALVALTHDRSIPIPAATRHRWWCILWGAYLEWPFPPWIFPEAKRWPIAPSLLEREETRAEVLQALAAEQPHHPGRPLWLFQCTMLTSDDLLHLAGLHQVTELNLTGSAALENLEALAELKELETLDLRNCTGLKGSKVLEPLAGLQHLKRLWLQGCIGLESLSGLGQIKSLKKLDLSKCTSLRQPAERAKASAVQDENRPPHHTCSDPFTELEGLIALEELSVSQCPGLVQLPNLSALQRLKVLNLVFCMGLKQTAAFDNLGELHALEVLSLSDSVNLEKLPEWNELNRLKELRVIHCRGLRGPEALANLGKLHALEKLDLSGCYGLESLLNWSGSKTLRELILVGCTGLVSLPDWSAMENLRVLDLTHCTGLKGDETFANLGKLCALVQLDLFGCSGLESIPDWSPLEKLMVLNLGSCVGLKGAAAVENLGKLRGLKYLNLDGCSGLSKEDVRTVRRLIPRECEMRGPDGVVVSP